MIIDAESMFYYYTIIYNRKYITYKQNKKLVRNWILEKEICISLTLIIHDWINS